MGTTWAPVVAASDGAGYTLSMLGNAVAWLPRAGWRMRSEILRQTALVTFGGFPVAMVVAIFTGMILALQSGVQLERFKQEELISFLVSASMVREMGPVMTAFILAGLIGSTYAAELGTMSVSEEVDALRVMSIDPVRFLAMPRIVALAVGCPLLCVYVNFVGIAGGAVVSHSLFSVSYHLYFTNAQEVLDLKDIVGSLLKALTFGCTIASVSCSQGLRAYGGAEGVGYNTMKSVVISFIFILIFDYFLTWVLYSVLR